MLSMTYDSARERFNLTTPILSNMNVLYVVYVPLYDALTAS